MAIPESHSEGEASESHFPAHVPGRGYDDLCVPPMAADAQNLTPCELSSSFNLRALVSAARESGSSTQPCVRRRACLKHLYAGGTDDGMVDEYDKMRPGPLKDGEAWVDALPDLITGTIFLTSFGLQFGQSRIQSFSFDENNRTDW